MSRNLSEREHLSALRRRVRLIMLVHSAEVAGMAPIPILRLHMFAYLSNVLAPVWHLTPLEGKVLKQKRGPYYPALQNDLDCLVGMGVVKMSDVGYAMSEGGEWRLEGSYILNDFFAAPILAEINRFEGEADTLRFIRELGFALSSFSDSDIDDAMTQDATYSDALIDVGNVIDFAEYRDVNYSARAATFFERFLPASSETTAGEKLYLYLRHLRTRIHGAR